MAKYKSDFDLKLARMIFRARAHWEDFFANLCSAGIDFIQTSKKEAESDKNTLKY